MAIVAAWLLSANRGPISAGFDELWVQWDAEHLLKIARLGYTDPDSHPHATVFFPLFPLLVRFLTSLGVPAAGAGLLVSMGGSLVAFTYLYRLVSEEYGSEAAHRAIAYLAFFPTAVFLVAPYTEGLFLAGAIPSFYYARRQRWLAAGIFSAVAVASRNTGIFLLVGLGFEFLRQRNFSFGTIRRAATGLALGAAPLMMYGLYLLRVKGEFFYFVTDYRSWGRTLTDPVSTIATSFSMTVTPLYPTNWMMAMRGEIIAAVFGIVVLVWALSRNEAGYAAFVGSLLLVLMASPFLYSSPRSMLQLFPSVVFLADITTRRPRGAEWLLVFLVAASTMGVIVYTQGYWFY